jgi:hypothetical protein
MCSDLSISELSQFQEGVEPAPEKALRENVVAHATRLALVCGVDKGKSHERGREERRRGKVGGEGRDGGVIGGRIRFGGRRKSQLPLKFKLEKVAIVAPDRSASTDFLSSSATLSLLTHEENSGEAIAGLARCQDMQPFHNNAKSSRKAQSNGAHRTHACVMCAPQSSTRNHSSTPRCCGVLT